MPDTNAGIPRLFHPWGGSVRLTISATEYVVKNLVPGTLNFTPPFKEKHRIFNDGVLAAILDGNSIPAIVSFSVRLVDLAGAGELYTLLSGSGTDGEAKLFTIELRVPRALGSANYHKLVYQNCALADQPAYSEQGEGLVHLALSFFTKDEDLAAAAV